MVRKKSSVKNRTKHRKAGEALKESEERYKKQFDEALDGIFIADAKTGIILDCNKAACELVEWKKSELIGKHQRILHPSGEIKGKFSRTFGQHLKEKEGEVLEAQIITKNRGTKDVAIKANLFEFKGKKLIQGIFRDITAQKKAQETFSRVNMLNSVLVENAPFGIFTVNRKGDVEYVNSAMLRISGDTKKEFMKINVFKLPTYIKLGLAKKIKECFRSRSFFAGPLSYTSHYGKKKTIRNFTGIPVINENDKIEQIMIFVEDVTKIKEVEEELKESERYLKTILDSVQSGIAIIDAKTHNITDVNPAAANLIGAPKEKIIGHICHKYICPAEKGKCPITDLGQEVDNSERVLLKANGERIPILKTVTSIILRDHKYLLENFVDISERKEAEEKIKERTEELEKFHKIAVGRELKMIELKKRVKELEG